MECSRAAVVDRPTSVTALTALQSSSQSGLTAPRWPRRPRIGGNSILTEDPTPRKLSTFPNQRGSLLVFDPQAQKRIMGQFATGVTVASTCIGDETWGMTANAVTSLSLNPPQVLLCIVRDSQSHAKFNEGGCFGLSILSAGDEELSNRFAFQGPKDFSNLETFIAETGAPILQSAIGWVDCRIVEIMAGGDHDIFIGEIVAGDVGEGSPLLYYQGKYARLQG